MQFILSCTQSESSFVRSVVRYGIFVGRCNSHIVRNVVFMLTFQLAVRRYVCGNVSLNTNSTELNLTELLLENSSHEAKESMCTTYQS